MSNTLTELEVAAALRISTKTLQRWRASGVGPAFAVVAGRIRYPREALVDYLAERVVLPKEGALGRPAAASQCGERVAEAA